MHLLASAAAAGPLDDGMAAAQKGDYAAALTLLRPIAEQGDPDAEYTLGDMYDRGNGVPQDYKEAVKWYMPAAEKGVAAAQDRLGFFYSFGKGVPRDYAEAAKWDRRAAEQGVATAQTRLGTLYANGWGLPKDPVSAEFWFILAAANARGRGRGRVFRPGSRFPSQVNDPRPARGGATAGAGLETEAGTVKPPHPPRYTLSLSLRGREAGPPRRRA